jgi:hypothetical protein
MAVESVAVRVDSVVIRPCLSKSSHVAALHRLQSNHGFSLARSSGPVHERSRGSLQFVGFGRKTDDQPQTKERFKSLNIPFDWERLDETSFIRNHIEHYYFDGARPQIDQASSDAQFEIRDLLVNVLREDPLKVLGAIWNVILDASAVVRSRTQGMCGESCGNQMGSFGGNQGSSGVPIP